MRIAPKFGLCALLCLAAAQAIAADEPTDGRVRLYIKAEDPDGGKLFFLWKQLEGPPVKIADPAAGEIIDDKGKKKWVSDTYFIPTEPGKYIFEISVKNEDGKERKANIVRDVLPATPPPTAVAGKDQNKTVGEIAVVNGIDSKAGEGRTIAEWEWRVVQAPEKFKIDAKKLKERQFDFKIQEPGVFQFELRVFDGKRWSEPSRVTISGKPDKPAPVVEVEAPTEKIEIPTQPALPGPSKAVKAVAAPYRNIKVGETIILDGSASTVDESQLPEFFWRQMETKAPLARQLIPDRSKPFSKKRNDPLNYPVWQCTPTAAGDYTFVLEITTKSAEGKEQKAESEPVVYHVVGAEPVKVADTPPTPPVPPPADALVAKISAIKTDVEVGENVRLDGSKSKGEKLEYIWGPVPGKRYPRTWAGTSGPEVEFRAEEEGPYHIALVVTDGKTRSEAAEIVIQAAAANKPPTVTLAKSYEGMTGEQVRMEAEIKDPENDRVEIHWECLDPKTLKIPDDYAKNKVLVFVPRTHGNYVFRVTIKDAQGRTVQAETQVGVKEAVNRPPTALIVGPIKAPVGRKVILSGAGSKDPEKKALTYFWKQETVEGGPRIAGPVPGENKNEWSFTPEEQGSYIVSLVVSDGVNKSEPERFELTATRENVVPVARLAAVAEPRLAIGGKLTLDGAESADPEGEKLKFKWQKSGGKGEVELAGADTERCEVTGVTGGAVEIELIVNDGASDSAPARVQLQVARQNSAPVAVITGPESARAGAWVELSGVKSSDPDAGDEITSYIWSQPADGGPESGVRGRELRKRDIRFKPEKPGTYVLNLKVVDAEGLSSEIVTHKVEVKGANRPPRVEVSRADDEALTPGKEVKLRARGLDPEGAALTYKWKQLSGTPLKLPTEQAEIINLVPETPGEYELECIVNDGDHDSPPAKVAFRVQSANQAPVAVIAPIAPCEPGERITLDASASRDPDGDKIAEYRWSRVSGPDAKFPWRGTGRPKVEIELPTEGEYVFELKVFDGKEWSEPQKVSVKTRAHNVAPVADFSLRNVRTEENVETILDASASTDPDGGPRPLTYTWRQIEGVKMEFQTEGAQARFTPRKMGPLTFQLKVSDGKAESAPAEVRVVVLKAGTLPVAVARAKPNPVKVAVKGVKNDPNVLELNATESRPGAAANGVKQNLTFAWTQVGGDDLRLPPGNLAKDRVGIRFFVPGLYRFMLVVSDGQNTSQPVYVEVKVVDESGAKPAPEPKPDAAKPPDPKPTPDGAQPDGALLPPPKNTESGVNEAPPAASNAKEVLRKSLEDLARNQGPDAEQTLIAALSSEDKDIRGTAAAALYRRGLNSIPALINVLEAGDAVARKEAHWALKELTNEKMGQDAEKWKNWWAQQPTARSAATSSPK